MRKPPNTRSTTKHFLIERGLDVLLVFVAAAGAGLLELRDRASDEPVVH
jgi:hypothetical protein